MHRPSAEEFLLTLLESLDELPPNLAQRFAALLKNDHVDRAVAIRQLFEDAAGAANATATADATANATANANE